jgi:uncharacterized protein
MLALSSNVDEGHGMPGVRALTVRNISKATVLGDRIIIANTDQLRKTGLLNHERLLPGEGIWLIPCSAVHTVGMQFPIDVLFLDRAGTVIQIEANARPGIELLNSPGYAALELGAGRVAQTKTKVGDRLEFVKCT